MFCIIHRSEHNEIYIIAKNILFFALTIIKSIIFTTLILQQVRK